MLSAVMPTWGPEQYLRFEEERTRPCRDLVGRIPLDDALSVIDLGCGPGNSTAVLGELWPRAKITGSTTRRQCSSGHTKSFRSTNGLGAIWPNGLGARALIMMSFAQMRLCNGS